MEWVFQYHLKERRKVDCVVPSIDNFKKWKRKQNHNGGGGGETDQKKRN